MSAAFSAETVFPVDPASFSLSQNCTLSYRALFGLRIDVPVRGGPVLFVQWRKTKSQIGGSLWRNKNKERDYYETTIGSHL